jgi:hypothetical protein
MNEIYPKIERINRKPTFYVEFNRGDRPNEFTLFQRNFMYSDEELVKKMEAKEINGFHLLCNEVHPWNLFTAEYVEYGIPNKEWMVDALNEKAEKDSQKKS